MIGCSPSPNSKYLNTTNHKTEKLGLIIIKVPKVSLYHVPRCYGPSTLITKLTLTSQQEESIESSVRGKTDFKQKPKYFGWRHPEGI